MIKPSKLSAFLSTAVMSAVLTANAFAADVAIVIHGGAGTILKANMTPEREKAYVAKLSEAVKKGYALLQSGADGEVAVIETIKVLEQSPLFNAGIGAVYTFEGEHELDASIMHGGTLNAGAVAGVKTIASPIEAALAVMEHSPHVMLSGKGAEEFALSRGMKPVDNSIFDTERRYKSLLKAKERILNAGIPYGGQQGNERFGTVGAVVIDKQGNLVAGTSTGGMTAKRYGRIGDSPVIGAGTWADNSSCAVSATGHGEYFIRYHVAADICSRMKYTKTTLDDAANTVINDVLVKAGGDGGIIAIDHDGNIAAVFNSAGMYRAQINKDGEMKIGIYKEWID